jgi:hypothetical protein
MINDEHEELALLRKAAPLCENIGQPEALAVGVLFALWNVNTRRFQKSAICVSLKMSMATVPLIQPTKKISS